MIKCEWCGTECANLNSLSHHITNKHNNQGKLYYDTFLLKDVNEKMCICGKEKKYTHGISGYYKNCGNKNCRNILMNIAERQTCKEKYGSETYRNDKLNKQTKKERYGNENYNNRTQAKETCVTIYGVDNPNKTTKVRDKIKETCKIKYGGIAPACSLDIQNKMENTCVEKYDSPFYINSKLGRNIRKEKMINLYGTEHALQNNTIVNEMKENNLIKYGYEWPCQQPHYQRKVKKKFLFENLFFDSNLEIDFYKFLKNNNIIFEYQPNITFEFEYNNTTHFYNPDFKIDNIIVEIKGLHFFKNKNPNDVMICPYHKKDDTPETIKMRNELYEAKHQCMINNNVLILTNHIDFEKILNLINKI